MIINNFLGYNIAIQVWIKTGDVGVATVHYTLLAIMAAEVGGTANDWGFGVNNLGQLAFGAGSSETTIASSSLVNTNQWINVAVTREQVSGTIKLYINGQLDTTGNDSTAIINTNPTIWIGDSQDTPAYSMGGYIGRILAYTAVLSPSDIQNNYDVTKSIYGY